MSEHMLFVLRAVSQCMSPSLSGEKMVNATDLDAHGFGPHSLTFLHLSYVLLDLPLARLTNIIPSLIQYHVVSYTALHVTTMFATVIPIKHHILHGQGKTASRPHEQVELDASPPSIPVMFGRTNLMCVGPVPRSQCHTLTTLTE